MAVILYENGLVEEYKPKENVFGDEEIISKFPKDDKLRSRRLDEIINCWCIWGENKSMKRDNYNNIASALLGEKIFSKVLFIHDTEINPNWKLIDTPIYKNYSVFLEEIETLIEFVAHDIIQANEEYNKQVENTDNNHLMILNTIGPTKDKRILFELDLDKQDENFFNDKYFGNFARKVYQYLTNDIKEEDTAFVAFADSKVILMIRKGQTQIFLNILLDFFSKKEEYEKCSVIKNIKEKWEKKYNEQKDSSIN